MANVYDSNRRLLDSIAEKKFEVKTYVTGSQIENIIVSGLEGGINYWGEIVESPIIAKESNTGACMSERVTSAILSSEEVEVVDAIGNEKARYKLSLNRILKGIALNAINRPFDCDLDNMDSTTADCIIQYAVFNDVIFG